MARNPNASYHLADTMPAGEHYYTGTGTWTLDKSERGQYSYADALGAARQISTPSGRVARIVAEVV